MVSSIGATSRALVPVRSRALSFLALDINRDGSWGPAGVAAAGNNFSSRNQSPSQGTPGFLRVIDTGDDGRVAQIEFFAASLIAGTAQLLALQGEETAPKGSARNASAGREYDAASALNAYASIGTFIVAAV